MSGFLVRTALTIGLALALPFSSQAQTGPALKLEGSAAPSPWQRYHDWNKAHWEKYNTLAKKGITPPHGSVLEIKSVVGDAATGQKFAFDRSRGGGCLACHVMGPKTGALPGNVGPDLSEIGLAGRTDEWLYNYVFHPRVYNPG